MDHLWFTLTILYDKIKSYPFMDHVNITSTVYYSYMVHFYHLLIMTVKYNIYVLMKYSCQHLE